MNYRILTLLIHLITAFFGCLAQEATDTVKVIENAGSIVVVAKNGQTSLNAEFPDKYNKEMLHYQYEVTITNESDTHNVEYFSDNWGLDVPFVKDKHIRATDNKVRRCFAAVRRAYWGWRFNYGHKGNVKNSWEISIPDFIALAWKKRGAEFEIGAGFGMSRYSSMDGFFYEKSDDQLILSHLPEEINKKESSLSIGSFHIPVLYNQYIGKHCMFSIGAIMNFNTYAKATTKLMTSDKQYLTTTCKGLQQNLFTVDAYASVDLWGIGLFAKWSPMELFNQKFGPELKGFSIGIQVSLMNF